MLPLSLAEHVSSPALASLSRPETEGNIVPVEGMLRRGIRGPKGSAADPWDDTIAVSPPIGFEDAPKMERLAPETGISTGCRRIAPRLTPAEGSRTLVATDSKSETPIALEATTTGSRVNPAAPSDRSPDGATPTSRETDSVLGCRRSGGDSINLSTLALGDQTRGGAEASPVGSLFIMWIPTLG